MHLPSILLTATAYASLASAGITWTLEKSTDPTPDEVDAYARISDVMTKAVARHTRINKLTSKDITVRYTPGVPTAEASITGDVQFGSDRKYMTERCALHEIGHALGIGQTNAFGDLCKSNGWANATAWVKAWDGPDAKISCGGGHFWPYGLNYDDEWSEVNGDRNVIVIDAMISDGLDSY